MRKPLSRTIRVRQASHGWEEHHQGTLCYVQGTVVTVIGPSKVAGHTVVNVDGRYIRVTNASLE